MKTKKTEKRTFTYISNLHIDRLNYFQISNAGRMRWRIENTFESNLTELMIISNIVS